MVIFAFHIIFFFLSESIFLPRSIVFMLPLHRVPLPGMENHIPVVFLNLKRTLLSDTQKLPTPSCSFSLIPSWLLQPPADDLSSQDQFEVPEAGGWDAILSGEDEDDFFDLQIVKHYDGEVSEVVCWRTASLPLSQSHVVFS